MEFSSVQDVIDYFSIPDGDSKDLERVLRRMLGDAHVDRAGEQFDPKLFSDLHDALQFVRESSHNTQLVSVGETAELVKAVTALVNATTETKANVDTEVERQNGVFLAVDSSIRRSATRTRSINITGGIATSAVGIIWLFPNTVMNSPLLSKLFNEQSPTFIAIWSIVLLVGLVLWVFVTLRERTLRSLMNRLKNVEYQNYIFERFCEERIHRGFSNETFSRRELVNYFNLYGSRPPRYHMFLIPVSRPLPAIDAVEQFADAILSRAEEKGLIHKIERKSLSNYYRIDELIINGPHTTGIR